MELRNALSSKFGVELPPTITLDYPSVAALASHLATQLPTSGAPAVAESEPSQLDEDSNSEVTHHFIGLKGCRQLKAAAAARQTLQGGQYADAMPCRPCI